MDASLQVPKDGTRNDGSELRAWRRIERRLRHQMMTPVTESAVMMRPMAQTKICIGIPNTRAVCNQTPQRVTTSPLASVLGKMRRSRAPLWASKMTVVRPYLP